MLLVLCLCLSIVPIGGADAEGSYEYAWFPAPVMQVTQIAYENYSHGSQNAIDISPGGTVFAPFTGKIVYKDANWGYVVLQSTNKVMWADGSCDYMSVGFMHDENIGDLSVGQIINQGVNFYHAGGMGNGNPNAYGDHVHITVHRGRVTRGYPYGTGDKDAYAYKAFYVNKDKTPTSAGRGGGYVAPGGTVNNGAPTDYRELWKYINVTSEPTAFLSVNRRSYNPNDTITLTFGGNNNGVYTLGIYKDSNRIDTVTVHGSTYQFKLSETGNYSAYMTAYNNQGLADSNWVDWKVTDLTVTLSVNAEKHDIGNPVTLTIGGNNCLTTSDGPCTLGIFKEGQWFDTVTLYDENYSRSFSEPGAYSAYVTAYSETDYVDSDYVTWLVVEYPEAPTLRCPDLLYDANNDITFAWDACSKTDYYDFWVLQGDTDIYNMIGIESLSHTFRLPVGTYTAKVASVNRKYGTWTWSNTYEFTVDDRHPERPVLTVNKKEAYNGQAIRLSWNDCTNTDDYDFYVYDANGNTVLTDFYYTQLHKDVMIEPGQYTAIVASVNRTHGTWLWSNEVSFTVINHNCTYSYKVTKSPTTSATGTLTGTCSKCSGTTSVTLPKLDTTNYTYKVTKEPTCTATGTGRYTWKTTTYGSFYFDVSIAAKGHSYTSRVTAPTCTEQGYTTHTCACGHSYKDAYTNATGHSYNYAATKNPTTSATGTLTGTCSKCSGTTTMTLPKLNTTDYTYQVTKEPTCTATGTGRYTWKNTTYGSFYFDVSIAAKGHSYTSRVTAPTCTEQGYTTHTCACGHSYKDAYTNATGHSYNYVVMKKPTISETGTLTGVCTRCANTTTMILPKLNTTDYTYSVRQEPTCISDGMGRYTWKITSYGPVFFDVVMIATGHSYGYKATKAPTTSATGTLTGTCSKCSGTTTVTLPKLNTTDYTYQVTKEPTCTATGTGRYTWNTTTYGSFYFDVSIAASEHVFMYYKVVGCVEPGYTQYTCFVCGYMYQDDFTEPVGHWMDNWGTTKEATCTVDGEEQRHCMRRLCNHHETRVIEATGHDMGEWTVVTGATCTTAGTEQRDCSRCEHYETRAIAATGHSFTSYVSDHNATCTQDGTKTAVCDRCDATDSKIDVGSAHGHAFSNWTVVEEPTPTSDGLESRYCYHCALEETRTVSHLKNPFNDVPEGSFYYEPVLWAVENGITTGTSATTFGSDNQCMRAHVVTFLYRVAGSPATASEHNPFTDVKTGDFFYKPVLWAVEKGITNGITATKFGSVDVCNRAAVVTFLWRAVGSPEPKSTSHPFTDVKATDFFYKPVLWAVENGITNGVDATHFGPASPCNRAQVVTFLYRAYN